MTERKSPAPKGYFNCFCGNVHHLSQLGKQTDHRPESPKPELIDHNLLIAARLVAGKRVQKDDGHIYQVPAKDLVEYSVTILALVDIVEALQGHLLNGSVVETLRKIHVVEMFGDCTEDGDHFPCRTIQALDMYESLRKTGE